MENFYFKQIIPLLSAMEINPDELSPEKIRIIETLVKKVYDPSNNVEDILKEIRLVGRKEVGKQKRNAKCSCNSGKKSKKCCNK